MSDRPPSWFSTQSQRALTTKAGRIFLLLVITLLSILVHGYHMGTDDAAIYAPGIEKVADPSLFPFGSEFFMHHAGLSLFPRLVASITWLSRVPIEWSMLLWFAFAQFLLLWAGYQWAAWCALTAMASCESAVSWMNIEQERRQPDEWGRYLPDHHRVLGLR